MDPATTLPFIKYFTCPEFTVREISDESELHAQIWQWHARRPGYIMDANVGLDDFIGLTWRNYCFFFDGVPQVCVSVNERQPYGYEIHVAVASGTHPGRVRDAVRWVGDLLTRNKCRMISWFPKEHRAARRLNAYFLQYETEMDVNGETWVRYAGDSVYWHNRHHG